MKIFIATPMYGGNCKGIYTESLINLIIALANKGHKAVYSKVYNESLITRARNALSYEFEKSDCDALLFIDADHWFDADHVVKMIESDVDLIGAIYPMKNINWDMVRNAAIKGKEDLSLYSGFFSANLPKGQVTIKLDEPLEVMNVATGMMFIRRNVFEAMKPHCKTYAHHGNTGALDFLSLIHI
jgi:predicted glycosyltransferase involved in capsule biosynthesis